MDVLPASAPRPRPRDGRRRRVLLLSTALLVHLAVSVLLALQVPDRLDGVADPGPVDPSTLLFALVLGAPAWLALLCTALPGRGPDLAAQVLGTLGLVLALLLLPLYGLGLLLLPGAAVGFAAGLVRG